MSAPQVVDFFGALASIQERDLGHRWHLFLGNEVNLAAEATRRVIAATLMLLYLTSEIVGRADVVSSRCTP